MLTTCLRTIFIYLLLLFVIRVMGKRQIGELQTSEFIITILLSEIASAPITNEKLPLLSSLLPVLVLVVLELCISTLLLYSNPLKRCFYGSPSVLIAKGKIDFREMRRNRMEIDELISGLRQAGYSDPSEISYAILEENGRLSVFPIAGKAPLTPEDASVQVEEKGISHVCVIDGRVIENNLRLAGWDKKRLTAELKRRKLSLAEVFLLTVNDIGDVTCVPKKPPENQ